MDICLGKYNPCESKHMDAESASAGEWPAFFGAFHTSAI